MEIGKLYLMSYRHSNPIKILLRITQGLVVNSWRSVVKFNSGSQVKKFLLVHWSDVGVKLINLVNSPNVTSIAVTSLRNCDVEVYKNWETYKKGCQVKEYMKAVFNLIANMLSGVNNTTCIYGGCL